MKYGLLKDPSFFFFILLYNTLAYSRGIGKKKEEAIFKLSQKCAVDL